MAEAGGEEGNWWVKCEDCWDCGDCGWEGLGMVRPPGWGGALFAPWRRLEGAADWMVVRVVVRERTEGAGDEKVLPSPPVWPLELRPPPTVTAVPAFESTVGVSEMTVSFVVETVGALDFLLMACGCGPSQETGMDSLLCEGET